MRRGRCGRRRHLCPPAFAVSARRPQARRGGAGYRRVRTTCAAVGPNCLGFIRPAMNLNVTPARPAHPARRPRRVLQPVRRPRHRHPGLGRGQLRWASAPFVGVGSMADVDFVDSSTSSALNSHISRHHPLYSVDHRRPQVHQRGAALREASPSPWSRAAQARSAMAARSTPAPSPAMTPSTAPCSAAPAWYVWTRSRTCSTPTRRSARQQSARAAPGHRHQRRRPGRHGQRPPAAPGR